MLSSLIDCCVSCISVLKNLSVRGHPFVGRAYLTVCQGDESDDDGEGGNETSDQVPIRSDRPTAFIIDNSPNFSNSFFRTVKHFGSGRQSQPVNAIDVRCHGNSKHANIVRFLFAVPSPMHDCIQHWLTDHYKWDMEPYLFNYKTPKGRIRIPVEESDDGSIKQSIELYMKERAKLHTARQR